MQSYVKELEDLITDVLLPIYYEHYRLLKRPSPSKEINAKLTQAMRAKKKLPRLLEKDSYG